MTSTVLKWKHLHTALIFCGAERSQVINLNLLLLLYEALSRLHINMFKHIIYPVNEVHNLEELADVLYCNYCKTGSLPTTCLGLPVGAKFKSTESWNGVLERVEKKHMVTWCRAMETHQVLFQNISYKVGNGLHVKFSEDRWIGNEALKDSHSGLYQIACNQKATIAEYRENNNGRPTHGRNLNDWEVNDLIALLALLGEFTTDDQAPDRILWGNSKQRRFTVNENYNLLCSQNRLLEECPWKHVWRTKMPLKSPASHGVPSRKLSLYRTT